MLALLLAITLATPARAPSQEGALEAQLYGAVDAAYDTLRGGWVTKPGAPSESAIELGFVRGAAGDTLARARAIRTLTWSRALHDSVGGGYLQGSRDIDPRMAQLDKRTSSNARRLDLLVRAWNETGNAMWGDDARFVVDYMDRVLLDGRGGFVPGQVGSRQLEPEANGFAIAAWMLWAARTRDLKLRAFAWKSLDRVWAECYSPDFGMLRHGELGEVTGPPKLTDQVEMARACLVSAHLTGRADDLARARRLADFVLARFEDGARGGFRTTFVPTQSGGAKKAARLAPENARAARVLAALAIETGQEGYRDAARRTIRAFAEDAVKSGVEAAEWALALRAIDRSDLPARPAWPVPASSPSPPGRRTRR